MITRLVSRKSFRGRQVPIVNSRSILCAFLFISVAACSHTSPYYRDEPRFGAAINENEVAHRLLLIGDAGAPATGGEPVLLALERYASSIPNKTTIVFLGDNIYKDGMPDKSSDSRNDAERRIDAQIDVIRHTGARGIFIPGNHDWANGRPEGWNYIKNLGNYIDSVANDDAIRVHLYPPGGCPGPLNANLDRVVSVIILDTQWWLHNYRKPGSTDPARCQYTTERSVLRALKEQLRHGALSKRWVVLAAHHPLQSHGPHNGFADLKAHLFPLTDLHERFWLPLPVIGSIVMLVRWIHSPNSEDFSSPRYKHMRTTLQGALKEVAEVGAVPIVYAAGHDHSLQVITGTEANAIYLVSGSGSKSETTRVGHSDSTLFAHSHPGFMVMDFVRNGNVRLAVIEATGRGSRPKEVYSIFLNEMSLKIIN
jgi:hypothetical protein